MVKISLKREPYTSLSYGDPESVFKIEFLDTSSNRVGL